MFPYGRCWGGCSGHPSATVVWARKSVHRARNGADVERRKYSWNGFGGLGPVLAPMRPR